MISRPSRRPRFSGHQTFPFRYGWLEKGYQYVKEGRSFSDPDALVHLGVGKNMVESIKYWGEVFGLLDDDGITPFAKDLLDPETGWDPYLEDDASLWLLHWKLCSQSKFMTAATLLFGKMHKLEFDRQDWLDLLRKRDSQYPGRATSISTLERDMECCLKMYAPTKAGGKKRVLELSYACPFQELGLLSPLEGSSQLSFSLGPQNGLPPEITGYAIWGYMRSSERKSLRLKEVLYDDYAPGQIFMLDESSLVEEIMQLQSSRQWGQYFNLTASEGIETVYCSLDDGEKLLHAYYKNDVE